MIVSTKKLHLGGNTQIGSDYFFSIRGDIIYYSEEEGKSLEECIDAIIPLNENSLFVYEDMNEEKIYLVFTNSIEDTKIIDLNKFKTKEEFQNKIKFDIKISRLYTANAKVYFLEDSIIRNLFEDKDLASNNIEIVKDFKKHLMKQRSSKKRNFYLMKNSFYLLILIALFFAQDFYFENAIDEKKVLFNKEFSKIEKNIIEINDSNEKYKDIKGFNREKNIAYSYEQVLNKESSND